MKFAVVAMDMALRNAIGFLKCQGDQIVGHGVCISKSYAKT